MLTVEAELNVDTSASRGAVRPSLDRSALLPDWLRHMPAGLGAVLAVSDAPGLERGITFANVSRFRLLALMLVLSQPAMITLDWQAMGVAATLPQPVPWAMAALIALRAGLIVASAFYLILSLRVSGPAEADSRQRHLQYGYTVICLSLAGLWTAFVWPASIATYLLAVFTVAAFCHFRLWPAMAIFGSAWTVCTLTLMVPNAMGQATLPLALNSFALTVLAVLVSRFTYASEVRNFTNRELVEEQRAELAAANRQLAETNTLLRRLSFIDPLTDTPNRRYFDEYIRREWARMQRERTPLAVIMLDVDYFKEYNDTYGHQAGDECLIRLADTMAGALLRPADLLARYGGDEFAAVLPDCDQPGAMQVADRIANAVRSLEVPHESSYRGQVTVSLGVATHTPSTDENGEHGERLEDLLERADYAMYRAKANGRNRSMAAG